MSQADDPGPKHSQTPLASDHPYKELLTHISHEIRGPLNIISGFAELLSDENVAPEERISHAQRILSNSNHILEIVDEILNFFESKQSSNITSFNPQSVILEIVQSVQVLAKKKGIEVNAVLDPGASFLIETDQRKFRQVIFNLVINAIKFTDQGSVTVHLEHKTTSIGAKLVISVEDTGHGIPQELQAKVFLPFEQGRKTGQQKFGGSGLGLYFSKQLAETLGGSLNLDWSSLNEGSRFVLKIPV